MTLNEIQSASAAERRVNRMKANAKSARVRARQLQAQADTSAERLTMQQSRRNLMQLQQKAAMPTIKPHG